MLRQIKVPSLFSKYRIQSNSNNEITMVLSSEALMGALRSASSNPASFSANPGSSGANANGGGSSIETEEVVVRLAKKNDTAILSFEITGLSRLGRTVRVAHDVRIEVLKPADAARLGEPLCPAPDVCLSFRYELMPLTFAVRFTYYFHLSRSCGR